MGPVNNVVNMAKLQMSMNSIDFSMSKLTSWRSFLSAFSRATHPGFVLVPFSANTPTNLDRTGVEFVDDATSSRFRFWAGEYDDDELLLKLVSSPPCTHCTVVPSIRSNGS
jgi:hypothetical protein